MASYSAEVHDDTQDDFNYEDIDVSSFDVPNLTQSDDEDLDTLLQSLTNKPQTAESHTISAPTTYSQPSVVADYIRNFLIQHNLSQTYETFENEWLAMTSAHSSTSDPSSFIDPPTDVYIENQQLTSKVKSLERQLDELKEVSEEVKGTWDKFRKQRDFHKMHHRRVVQEKERLLTDIKRLKKHYEHYPEALKALQERHDSLIKQKSLLKLENDKLKGQLRELIPQSSGQKSKLRDHSDSKNVTVSKLEQTLAVFPDCHPELESTTSSEPSITRQMFSEKIHDASISSVTVHPSNSDVFCTTSDDFSWKLHEISDTNQLTTIASVTATSWLSSAIFHPFGTLLATSSGDGRLSLYDLQRLEEGEVAYDQSKMIAYWDLSFHYTGDFLAASSLDHTIKIFNINSNFQSLLTLRGHVDSVNSIKWLPSSNIIASGSADKTVSLWDCRTSQCIQSFFGHTNAIRSLDFSHDCNFIFSTDSDGNILKFDLRYCEKAPLSLNSGSFGINSITVHPTDRYVAYCGDDGSVVGCSTEDDKFEQLFTFSEHEDMVNDCAFLRNGKALLSVSSDCTVKLWN
ncbi:hypothetical protein GEMRC1_004144 [Eukaryota sp. GEM-RC1]